MRHQPFALWIKDLSHPIPDPVNLLAAAVRSAGFLASAYFRSCWHHHVDPVQVNPQQMDPVQQQIFSFMPWILMFVMAPFAAGLQLYWVVSNLSPSPNNGGCISVTTSSRRHPPVKT